MDGRKPEDNPLQHQYSYSFGYCSMPHGLPPQHLLIAGTITLKLHISLYMVHFTTGMLQITPIYVLSDGMFLPNLSSVPLSSPLEWILLQYPTGVQEEPIRVLS